MIQKALIVTAGPDGGPADALDEHLRAGWRVVHAAPMGGGGAADGFASLVVLERRAETEAEALLEQIAEEADDALQDPVLRQIVGGDDEPEA